MVQAAAFREWLTIYTPGESVDDGGGGQLPAGPESSLETWASVQPLPDKPILLDGKWVNKQPYRIILRYVNAPEVQFADCVEWGRTKIGISSVVVDAKKTVITINGYGQ
jgi:hypothetical protein